MKIQNLIQAIKTGQVLTSHYFKKMGISKELVHKYKKSGWIISIGHDAYVLSNSKPSLASAIYAFQMDFNYPIHIGGLFALELQGEGHYFYPDSKSKVHLYNHSIEPALILPKWFSSYNWQKYKVILKNKKLFGLNNFSKASLKTIEIDKFEINISGRERSILELISEIKDTFSFMECSEILEHLHGLRVEILQDLLNSCESIKTKRIFLFLSGYHKKDYLSQLKKEFIDLGTGWRQVVKNGQQNEEYLITIPKEIIVLEENQF